MQPLSNKSPKNAVSAVREYGGVDRNPTVENGLIKSSSMMQFGMFRSFVDKTALEAVIPYMEKWDAEVMMEMYDQFLKEKDPQLYEKVKQGKVAAIPENMILDCFQNHMIRGEEVKFNLNDFNKHSYEFVKNINDEYMQVITNHSMRNSFITTREIIYMLQKALEEVDPNQATGGEGQDSKEGKDNIASMCNKFLDSNKGQKVMEASKQSAIQQIDQMEKADELVDALAKDSEETEGNDQQAGKGDRFVDVKKEFEMMKMLKKIYFDSKALSDMLKESLHSTVSYFAASYREIRESVFESADISEILGAENVLDELFLAKMEDIETFHRKYKLKINVYIDISGSMSTNYSMDRHTISAIDLCKLLAVKMKSKGLLNEIYVFNNDVSKRKNLKHMLNTGLAGGTSIERVIQHIENTKIPSLILTDACDSIETYTDMAYFLTVAGGSPSGPKDILAQYKANGQGITFNMDNTFSKLDFRT